MKVLHIGTELQWRGGERQIYLLSEAIKKAGFESIIAFPKQSSALNRFKKCGFQIIEMKGKGGYHLRDALFLKSFCENNHVEIIHTHSGKAHSLGYLIKVLGYKGKLVVHRRVAFPIRKSLMTKKKYLSEKVDRFISISEAIKKDLISYGVSEEKIQIARSSVDDSKFNGLKKDECRKRLNLPTDIPLISIIAALTEEKGHETLFESLSNLDKNFLCLVAGDGNLKEKLSQKVKSLGLENKVKFLGFLEQPEILLKAIDILVVPSKSEGLGSIALDGCLAGNLVIASNSGGLPEIIKDKKTGYLFPVEDSAKLREILESNLNTSHSTLLSNAREHVKSLFSLEKMVSDTLSVYNKLK